MIIPLCIDVLFIEYLWISGGARPQSQPGRPGDRVVAGEEEAASGTGEEGRTQGPRASEGGS